MRDNFYPLMEEEQDQTTATTAAGTSNSKTPNTDKTTSGAKNQIMGAVGSAIDKGSQLLDSGINKLTGFERDGADAVVDSLGSVAAQFGPWGWLADGIIHTVNSASKITGNRANGFLGDTGMSAFLQYGMEDKSFRNAGAFINPLSIFTGIGSNNAAANAYANRVNKQKELFASAKLIADSQKKKRDASAETIWNTNWNNGQQLLGGASYNSVLAKEGAKLEFIPDISDFVEMFKDFVDYEIQGLEEQNDILAFQNGGSVIPTGALHKNKHHLEDDNEELKGEITHKGIPVITKEENGDIIQHAEIEKEEIILELSLSQKIEKLWKEGTEEAMIKAGKLLAEEIMTDTKDEAGLIEKVS